MQPAKTTPRTHALAWIGLAVALSLALLPVLGNALLAWTDYSPWGADAPIAFVGNAHFETLFSQAEPTRLLLNSALLSGVGFLGAWLLGVLAGVLIPRIRGRRWQGFALALLLAGFFVPQICWACGILPHLNGRPADARLWYWVCSALSGAGLVGFYSAFRAILTPGAGVIASSGWTALLWGFLCLSPDLTLTWLIQSPGNYAVMDTLDTYAYRAGLLNMEFGAAAAAYMLKAVAQAAIGALFFLFTALFRKKRKRPLDTVLHDRRELSASLWYLPLIVCAAVVTWLLWPDLAGEGGLPSGSSLLMESIAAVAAGGGAFLLAWAVISALRSVRFGVFGLIAGLLLATANPTVGQYLLIRAAGGINTAFAAVLHTVTSPGVLLLTLLCAQLARLPALHGRSAWRLAVIPACYACAACWSAVLAPVTFLTDQRLMPVGAQIRNAMMLGQAAPVMMYLLVLLPPLLLGLLGAAFAIGYRKPVDGL